MKKMSKWIVTMVLLSLLVGLCSCAMGDGTSEMGGGPGYYGGSPGGFSSGTGKSSEKMTDMPAYDSEITADTASVDGEPTEETPEENQTIEAGLVTASAWNDNQYYEAWRKYFRAGQTDEENGKFLAYYQNEPWGFDTTKRVKITVTEDDKPVVGAKAVFYDEAQKEYASVTDSQGIAYLFPTADEGTVTITSGETRSTVDFTAENRELTLSLDEAEEKANLIKLMFVIDVTGSMGDELAYIKAELADVIGRVAAENEQVAIDLAFLFYRDDGDTEKFAYSDFVTVTSGDGLAYQQGVIEKMKAIGGGDTPEAVDEALEMAIDKDWGDENSTKLIFHILDAPPHEEAANQTRFENAVKAAAKKGIRLSPVLCSGADSLCEYLVRQEAVYTGGTFIFITDHSGIGYEHYDPDLPNAVVEKLNDLLVRLINGYFTGEFADPVWWNATEKE